MTHQSFINLCDSIEYETLVESLANDPNRTEYFSNRLKNKILALHTTPDRDSPYFPKFKELCKKMRRSFLIKNHTEQDIVIQINSMISKNHFNDVGISPIQSISELSERTAYHVINKLFKNVITYDFYGNATASDKYLDLETNRFKPIAQQPEKYTFK